MIAEAMPTSRKVVGGGVEQRELMEVMQAMEAENQLVKESSNESQVCMYVCLFVHVCAYVYVRMRMYVCMYVRMYMCCMYVVCIMYVCMYDVCMYVCCM